LREWSGCTLLEQQLQFPAASEADSVRISRTLQLHCLNAYAINQRPPKKAKLTITTSPAAMAICNCPAVRKPKYRMSQERKAWPQRGHLTHGGIAGVFIRLGVRPKPSIAERIGNCVPHSLHVSIPGTLIVLRNDMHAPGNGATPDSVRAPAKRGQAERLLRSNAAADITHGW
jgi:hypothetical protein